MDVRFFLNRRIAFIKQLYVTASDPFRERKQKIEAKEEPFISSYSEEGEPQFLEEWLEAEESVQAIGLFCISMLSVTLHLYFKTWEQQIGISVDESMKPDFKKGWFHGYKAYFARHTGIKFENGPSNLAMLEELVLARNRIQHPDSITCQRTHYKNADLQKILHPFFVDEKEIELIAELDEDQNIWLISPAISVSREKLFTALTEVERFAEWLEQVEIQ